LDLTCDIYLDEIVLVNTAGIDMPYNATKTAEEGICKYTIKRAIPPYEGRLDLMTQYPSGYNGEGQNMASDAFPPQGVVQLKALVTYRGDVVPGKLVSYAIRSPSKDVFYATNFTDSDGFAVFEYSLPGSNFTFGLWTVDAGVDLAGTMVSDKLYFLMGWLVQPVEVSPYGEAYTSNSYPGFYKGKSGNVNVTYIRICMQDPKEIMNQILRDAEGKQVKNNALLFHITVTDELKQPVATSLLNDTIESIPMSDPFVKGMNGLSWTEILAKIRAVYPEMVFNRWNGFVISESAFSGKAIIHANVLTNDPGVPYSPEKTADIWIKKE
jgi:hypothetical protein